MSQLKSMFNGCVLMNDSAINNEAIMNVLQSEYENNFEFKSIDSTSYNISDRDQSMKVLLTLDESSLGDIIQNGYDYT